MTKRRYIWDSDAKRLVQVSGEPELRGKDPKNFVRPDLKFKSPQFDRANYPTMKYGKWDKATGQPQFESQQDVREFIAEYNDKHPDATISWEPGCRAYEGRETSASDDAWRMQQRLRGWRG